MLTFHLRSIAAALAVVLAGIVLPAAATPEPTVLTVPRLAPFDSLDPPRAFDQTTNQLVHQIYSTLLTYSYLERPYKIEPDLLDRMPEVAADKVTLTLHLRKGVHFHDNACFPGDKGREMTSDDVLYSLKRYADANINAKSWFAMEGAVVGLDAYRAATAKAGAGVDLTQTDVAGLQRIDAHTFTIKLTHENPLFLYALTLPSTAIVPVEAVQMYKDRFGNNPVGTGPFMAKGTIERKATVRLVRNPDYFRVYPSVGEPGDAEKGLLKDAGKRLPLVDRLDMPLIEEAQPAALMFLRGELDLRPLDRASFTKLVQRGPGGDFHLVDEYAPEFNIFWTPGADTLFLILNLKDPLLGKNKILRRALAYAMDTQSIIDVLLNGRGRKLQSLMPYDLPGNERETGSTLYPHDIAAAKRLLAEAGYPAGKGLPPLSVSFGTSSADTHNLFDLMRTQFAAIGVQLTGEFEDMPSFVKALEGGNFQLAYSGWVADYPDPRDFFQLLDSHNVAPGPNYGSYSNPAYDRAFEAARNLPNGPQRIAHIRTMNALIKDDVPLIVMYDPLRFGIAQKWVGNFKRNLFIREEQYLSVDMQAKKRGL